MPPPNYPWKRYWAPREGKINLGDDGYLIDPKGKHGAILNPDLVALPDLDETRCLVLLGEAGIGKSRVVEEDCNRLKRPVSESGADFIRIDLRSFGSEDRLVRTLFEGPTFMSWKNGASRLHLYVDSLDECSVRITNLAALFAEQLADVPHDRLWLRVACRTAEWPALLENALKTWYGSEQLRILELAPLHREDVQLAATAHGASAPAFLESVATGNAVPLAIKPITLEFLIHLFVNEGTLPSKQVELYERGCSKLCEEVNLSWQASQQTGNLSTNTRLDVASWIAFFTIFSGKGIVQTAATTGSPSSDAIDLAELAEVEGAPGIREMREVFSISGFFSSRGASRLGWAHKTYAEFLAARFVAKLPYPQVHALVFHHQDSGTVVPQLKETTAWLASMRNDVFDELAEKAPEVLLNSDVADVDDSRRALLAGKFLKAFDQHAALDDNWDERRLYAKLHHPGIANQLAPYIVDKAKNIIVRRVAIDIAEACQLRELQEVLLGVALDADDGEQPRIQAAYAVARIADLSTKVRLRALLDLDPVADPDDELRGVALRALYPAHLTTRELFSALHPPKRELFHGAYASFIYGLEQNLPSTGLPETLAWALQMSNPDRYGPLATLQDAVLVAAWKHADDPAVLPGLAALVAERQASHTSPFGKRDAEDASRPSAASRRRVVAVLLADRSSGAHVHLYRTGQLLDQEDLPWLMDEFERDPEASLPIARLIARMVWREVDGDVAVLDRAIGLGLSHPALGEQMTGMLAPVELASSAAIELREQHREMLDLTRPQPRSGIPDLADRVEHHLAECEQALDWACWWSLTQDLRRDVDAWDVFDGRVDAFPGWVSASENLRGRILAVAYRFILEGDPENDKWFGTTDWCCSALGGYRALELLRSGDPARLAQLGEATWVKWLPTVISYPNGPSKPIVEAAAAKAQAEMLDFASKLLDRQAEGELRVEEIKALDYCWSEQVASFILQKAEKTPHPAIAHVLIEQGLKHGDRRFVRLAEERVAQLAPSGDEKAAGRRITLFALLVRHALSDSWASQWRLMQSDRISAREVWLSVAGRVHRDTKQILAPLSPDRVVDLYLWLRHEFPDDARGARTGPIRDEDSITNFRDAVIGNLHERGEWECLSALDRVIAAFPNDEFVRFRKVLARRAAAQATWIPPAPRDLAALVAAAERRMIESAGQLLDVVRESLERFQADLLGELRAVRDLWDKCAKDDWRPVDENDLSDRVARHLRADLADRKIVVNREVKIRRGLPGLQGQQTDIYVDAFFGSSHIQLIIETKGCWNAEVRNAMQTQLRDRYLQDNVCTHGLYLVGYFLGDGWSDTDGRKSTTQRLLPEHIDDLRGHFAGQASTLSVRGKTLGAFVLDARLSGPSGSITSG